MENSRTRNSVRNAFFGVLRYLATFGLSFALRTVIVLRLGIDYVGVTSLFSSLLQVLTLSELGFSTAIIFSLYEPVANNNEEKICQLLSFYRRVYRNVGFSILFVGILLCPFLSHLISGTYPKEINIYVIYLLLLVNTAISYLFSGYKNTIFLVYQRSDITSKIELFIVLVTNALQIILIMFFSNYYLYIICLVFGTIFNNILVASLAKKMFPKLKCRGSISSQEKRTLLKKVFALFGHQLDMVIITSADNIVISKVLGLTVLGYYSNYLVVINALMSIIRMISSSFLASIGNSITLESKEKNYKDLINFTYLINTITGVCDVIMCVVFQDFISVWLGRDMQLENIIVLLMGACFYFRLFKHPGNTYKEAMGLWDADFFKPYIAGITNLVLNLLMVQVIGLNGVVLSTIISLLFIEMPWETYVLFNKYFESGFKKYVCLHFKLFVKMVAVFLVMYFLFSKYICNNFVYFFIKLVAVSVTTIAMYIILSIKDGELIYILDKIKFLKKGY